jgi:hypothetical protein
MHELSVTGYELLQQRERPLAIAQVNLSYPKGGQSSQADWFLVQAGS